MDISALKSGNFRLYLSGNLFSSNALWMLRVTVGWIAWDITGSASFVGLIAFLYFAPTTVAGPLFGVLTDRVNVRTAALITQSSLMTMALILLALHLLDLLGPPQLVIYATAAGMAQAANGPIRMSLTPRLVDRDRVSSVVNFVAINFNLARMTGPAIGGWLLASFGTGVTLTVTAVCYLPFLAALTVLRVRPRENARQRPPPFLAALAEGLRHFVGNPLIREVLVLIAISSFFVRGSLELLPVLADGVFGKGAAGLGALTSSVGLGSLLGGLTLAMLPQHTGTGLPARIYVLAAMGLIGSAMLGLTGLWAAALGLVAVMAFCATMIGITGQAAIQMTIDDDMRGRVMSLWAVVAIGSTAAGAAVLGVAADVLGFPQTLLLAAGLALAILLAAALRAARR